MCWVEYAWFFTATKTQYTIFKSFFCRISQATIDRVPGILGSPAALGLIDSFFKQPLELLISMKRRGSKDIGKKYIYNIRTMKYRSSNITDKLHQSKEIYLFFYFKNRYGNFGNLFLVLGLKKCVKLASDAQCCLQTS